MCYDVMYAENKQRCKLYSWMVLAPLQKLKIKYELSYQSTTRLKYIDKFDQLLIIQQWTSTVDNTVRSLIHFTIFFCSISQILIKPLTCQSHHRNTHRVMMKNPIIFWKPIIRFCFGNLYPVMSDHSPVNVYGW
jgi:hypothetical protein